jgi:hypothetical protein
MHTRLPDADGGGEAGGARTDDADIVRQNFVLRVLVGAWRSGAGEAPRQRQRRAAGRRGRGVRRAAGAAQRALPRSGGGGERAPHGAQARRTRARKRWRVHAAPLWRAACAH